MKKVLMIASEASHFKNFHIPYIKYLKEQGIEVFTASNGAFAEADTIHTRLCFKKKLFHIGNIGVMFKLSRLIRKSGIDAVYTNSTLAGFVGRAAALLSAKKSVKAVHICHGYLFSDNGSFRSKVYLFFEKLVRKRTDLLAVMNQEDLKIAEKHGLGKQIVFINGMGVPPERFLPLPDKDIEKMRNSLKREGEELLFLCAGEFSERKNQKAIIEALSRLTSDKLDKCRLVLAGEGQLTDECKALADSFGLSGKITFLGHFGDMNLLYRSCDCLISASRFEGLPFNVMEALYCGEDIIVSDVKGNRDLCGERCGSLFPYGDTGRLSELMSSRIELTKAKAGHLDGKYLTDHVVPDNLRKLYTL